MVIGLTAIIHLHQAPASQWRIIWGNSFAC